MAFAFEIQILGVIRSAEHRAILFVHRASLFTNDRDA